MKKHADKISKTLTVSLIFLIFGVLVAIGVGNFLLSFADTKSTPITPIATDTTKITGYNGTIEQRIIDNSNNLYFTNYDEKEENVAVYKLEHDTTRAIELISRPYEEKRFIIQLDKNNNLYINQRIFDDNKWFKVEHDTTNTIELNITGFDSNSIINIWFDNNNNLFFHYNNPTTHNVNLYKLEHDTTTAIEITGFTEQVSEFEKIQFDNENNLWVEIKNNTFNYRIFIIKNNTTNAIKITENIKEYGYWTIDNENNLYFIKPNDDNPLFGTLFRVNKNTTTAIEITGYNSKANNSASANLIADSENNLWFNDDDDNLYQINSNSTIATLITGFTGNINNFIIDSENNLWLSKLTALYVIKNNTTNAIKIMDIIYSRNFIIKNNNLYFAAKERLGEELKDKIYQIKPNTFIATKIETPKEMQLLEYFWFDNNNLYFITNDNQIFKTIKFIK